MANNKSQRKLVMRQRRLIHDAANKYSDDALLRMVVREVINDTLFMTGKSPDHFYISKIEPRSNGSAVVTLEWFADSQSPIWPARTAHDAGEPIPTKITRKVRSEHGFKLQPEQGAAQRANSAAFHALAELRADMAMDVPCPIEVEITGNSGAVDDQATVTIRFRGEAGSALDAAPANSPTGSQPHNATAAMRAHIATISEALASAIDTTTYTGSQLTSKSTFALHSLMQVADAIETDRKDAS